MRAGIGACISPSRGSPHFFLASGSRACRSTASAIPWLRTHGVRPWSQADCELSAGGGMRGFAHRGRRAIAALPDDVHPLSRRGPRIAIAMLDDPHLRKKRRANPLRCQWIFIEESIWIPYSRVGAKLRRVTSSTGSWHITAWRAPRQRGSLQCSSAGRNGVIEGGIDRRDHLRAPDCLDI